MKPNTLFLTAAAMVAFAANSVLCRLALGAGLIDAASFATVRTVAGAVLLAGILLKLGTYGILRISYPMLPDAAQWFAYPMVILGAINILYGAYCAMAQSDMKKLVAYSSVSHMGYVLLGMAAFTQAGINGAVLQMFNHGTITAMLFLSVGVVYDRAHTREINGFGGLGMQMPRYFWLAMVGGENDQRIRQTDFLVNEGKKFSKGAIQMRNVVFRLEARRPEQMPDIVS